MLKAQTKNLRGYVQKGPQKKKIRSKRKNLRGKLKKELRVPCLISSQTSPHQTITNPSKKENQTLTRRTQFLGRNSQHLVMGAEDEGSRRPPPEPTPGQLTTAGMAPVITPAQFLSWKRRKVCLFSLPN